MTVPWIASYGVCLKRANNSRNTYLPLLLRALRKLKKIRFGKLARLKKIELAVAFLWGDRAGRAVERLNPAPSGPNALKLDAVMGRPIPRLLN
ncbi:MAG TPA: hypothetical protein VK653_10920 [Xanthobacteraceae bacterium]|jgi:hypothetical protein|nr:hypothetical protein [Xanthobacteraceae bacterium]